MCLKLLKSENGIAMVFALLITLIITAAGFTLWHVSNSDALQVERSADNAQAYYYAKSGVELAIGQIKKNIISNPDYQPSPNTYYGSLGNTSFTTAPTNPPTHSIEYKITRSGNDFTIDSKGIVRKGNSSGAEASSDAVSFTISLEQLRNSMQPGGPGNGDGPPWALFAMGVSTASNQNDISLSRTPSISGYVGTNSTRQGGVYFNPNGTQIKGKLYVGYNATDPESVVSHPSYTTLASHIMQLPVLKLSSYYDYPLPLFPNFPNNLDSKGNITTDPGVISGSVRDSNNNGIGDVTIYLSPAKPNSTAKTSVTTVNNPGWTSGHGTWTAYTTGTPQGSQELQQGTVIVTPRKDGFTFTPQSVEVTGPATNINFIGTPTIAVNTSMPINNSQTWSWKIGQDGYYDTISVTSGRKLCIDLGGGDRILRIKNLNVSQGEIFLTNTGQNGRLILYIDNSFTLGGSSQVNIGGDPNKLIMFYRGSNNINIGGSQAFVGSIFIGNNDTTKTPSDITLGGSCSFKGTLVSSGNNIIVEGGSANAVKGLIYAPKAYVQISASAVVTGSVISNICSLSGGNIDLIVGDNLLDTTTFNSLNWGSSGPPSLLAYKRDVSDDSSNRNWRVKGKWINQLAQ
ncbi:hypothetical protein GJ688_10345 [Heliobacillus mobilis]|uniref:DUF7305 domain-containing protein n=1 Tax=Heliobacterium mobile TaxID=28064 RepID=A0A6I3SLM1_HELMO|nr:hypothetical protein [Heliobacterium mobile]MTV49377.1 hypothetical protein [Heliobacterium mobile]